MNAFLDETLLDLTPGGSLGLSLGDLRAATGAARRAFGYDVNASWRADAARWSKRVDAAVKDDPRRADAALGRLVKGRDKGTRADARGFHSARDLEYVYADVLREPMPAMTGTSLFFLDTSVPVGAKTHKIRRVAGHGEAAVYKAGDRIPTVGVSKSEVSLPIHHYVIGWETDLFSEQADAFSAEGISEAQEKARNAREIMARFFNRMTWHGDPKIGLYGVFSFPWLPVIAPSVAFDGTESPDDVIAALNWIADYSHDVSKATFASDRLATSPRIRSYLFQTPRSSTSDTSIGKWFLDNHPRIKAIDEAPELHNPKGDGYDGILAYRGDRLGIANVLVQPFTTLPVERQGFANRSLAYMSHGGVNMRDVGNNLLAYVRPRTSAP